MLSQMTKKILLNLLMTVLFFMGGPVFAAQVWQMPAQSFGSGDPINLASDASGHAITLFTSDDTGDVRASYYSNGAWGTPVVLYPGLTDANALAMDATGTALAIFHDEFDTGNLLSRYFDGSTWSTPTPDPLDSFFTFPDISVSMNGLGQGVGIWMSGTNIKASFFSAGAWSAPTIIGTGDFLTSVAYSANGTAVAAWYSLANGVVVANYIGGVWQPEILLAPTARIPMVGIDAAGNAIVSSLDSSGNVQVNFFNGTLWSGPHTISAAMSNFFPMISMSPNGTALVVWKDSTANGISSAFNGSTWGPPVQFSTTPLNADSVPAVSLDAFGNGLVVWGTTAAQVVSARLPAGGSYGPIELVSPASQPLISRISSSLSNNGVGFAAWATTITGEFFDLFANATIEVIPPPVPPLPPVISGRSCDDNFATQKVCVNIITWTPSSSPSVVAYYLRRNGVLIATFPATGPFIYIDYNPNKHLSTYALTAVDGNGLESTPVVVILK